MGVLLWHWGAGKRLPASGAKLLRSDIKMPFRGCHCATLRAEGRRLVQEVDGQPALWPQAPASLTLPPSLCLPPSQDKRGNKERGQEVDPRREGSGIGVLCSARESAVSKGFAVPPALRDPFPGATRLPPPLEKFPAWSQGEPGSFPGCGESLAKGVVYCGWTVVHMPMHTHTRSHVCTLTHTPQM